MDPLQVRAMPARMFWCMERNISRIRAEEDMRMLRALNGAQSKEATKQAYEDLAAEVGETCQIRRPKIVKPEPNVKEKFKRLMGK